jgi:hypothetical protein
MPQTKIRKPAVSGQFYAGSAERLKDDVKMLTDRSARPEDVIGCILPHAGYIYSGQVAGKTVSRIIIKDNVVLLGPNHTGLGAPFSIMIEGAFKTPLGEVQINTALAKAILDKSKYLTEDTNAHIYEHSLEVELPFLQYYNSAIKIVPMVLTQGEISIYEEIGKSIALAVKESGLQNSTLIIASSDMTHYEPQKSAEKKDKQAIEAILGLDEGKLIDKINKFNISMCGYVPSAIMLVAVKCLGAKAAELVSYQTSGDVTGDYGSVVGYAGIIVR